MWSPPRLTVAPGSKWFSTLGPDTSLRRRQRVIRDRTTNRRGDTMSVTVSLTTGVAGIRARARTAGSARFARLPSRPLRRSHRVSASKDGDGDEKGGGLRRTRPSSTPRTTGSPTGSRVTSHGPRAGSLGTRATREPARSRRSSASPATTAKPTDRPRTRAKRTPTPTPRTGPTSTAATRTTTCTSSRTT